MNVHILKDTVMSAAAQICIDDDFCHVRFIHLNRVRAARLAKLSDKETARMAAVSS